MEIDKLLKITSKYDTPTMCNAMDVILGTRTDTGFTRNSVVAAQTSTKPIVGFAKTAKIRALSPPLQSQKRLTIFVCNIMSKSSKTRKIQLLLLKTLIIQIALEHFGGS